MVAPLTDILKRNAFQWYGEAVTAFEAFKTTLITASVLKLPDFSDEFIMECDISGRGIGAVLQQ